MIPDSSDTIFTAVQNDSSESSKSSVKENSSVSETEKNESETTKTPEVIMEQSETEVSGSDTNNEEENISYFEPEDTYPVPSHTEEPSEEEINSYSEDEESQEEINDEDEYQEEKPSLSDYLSGLRCSGCRHNCSLLSPRCMNGARKASQAESTYYSTYGA